MDFIGKTMMLLVMQKLEELKKAQKPLRYGEYMKFKNVIPKKSPDELLGPNAYWCGYAEALREFIAEFSMVEHIPLKAK